jgi:hypothetical protein
LTKESIECTCIDELAAQFNQVSHTPFLHETLYLLIGPIANSPAADEILEGTFECPPGTNLAVQKLLPYLKMHPNVTSAPPCKLPSKHITTDQYVAGWKASKEKTSAGKGAHFSMYKATSLCESITPFEAMMADIPYSNGFSPPTWEKGTLAMLEKKLGVAVVMKLHAIVLFEAYADQNNKHIGHDLLTFAEKFKAVAPEQGRIQCFHLVVDQALNK